MIKTNKTILWFKEIDKDDIELVGGKGANLGEMTSFGIPVPPGFVVCSSAYFAFLEENKLTDEIKKILLACDKNDPYSYTVASERIQKLFNKGRIPREIALEIMKSYLKLSKGKSNFLVAVRSSATAEDLPTASFAGQQKSFLNVFGESNLVEKVRQAWASLFEPRAIFYREEKNFDHFRVGLAVPVQKMVQSDSSGVIFTVDPVSNEKNHLVIEAIYGLGEYIVQGTVTPDRYVVDKNSLKIIEKNVSVQPIKLVKVGSQDKEVDVPKSLRGRQKIDDKKILALARIANQIQKHYYFPQDIEWAIEEGKIYIVQTRPITTLDQKNPLGEKKIAPFPKEIRAAILTGIPASPGIGTGLAKIIHRVKEIDKIKKGEVLVTEMTTPDFVPAMKKAAAIVTDQGGQTSHAAIVSRELGIPCVVGTQKGTKVLKTGLPITVNGSTGEIYKAFVNQKIKEKSLAGKITAVSLEGLKTATKLYVNLAEPDLAPLVARQNVDGVGLLRAEFMIADLGTHPKKLIKDGKSHLFVNHLAEKMSVFCEHFYPRPVVYRATDFKTNEYRNLVGGKLFEPVEPNPMLGFRGAFRYLSDPGVFELELEAIRKVRRDFNNLWLMIPFVHMPWELAEIKKIVAGAGLFYSESFKLWMMVEIPSNVILLEDFLKIGIDGVSIGSNDLTMLILGIDRDNSEVAKIFNEQDPAILWALEKIIRTCHIYKVSSSICGQAVSAYPDLVEKLVNWGITSISVNPDALKISREIIYRAEQKKLKKNG